MDSSTLQTLEQKLVAEGKVFKAWLATDWKHVVYTVSGVAALLHFW